MTSNFRWLAVANIPGVKSSVDCTGRCVSKCSLQNQERGNLGSLYIIGFRKGISHELGRK